MAERSKIEWCDATFNPWIGCTSVSPGCDHCYAEQQDKFRGWTPAGWGAGNPRRRTSDKLWGEPLKWNDQPFYECASCGWRGTSKEWERGGCCSADNLTFARRRVFCASLADVFDNEVPVEWLRDFLNLCLRTPNLDKLLLTKRIGNVTKRLQEVFGKIIRDDDDDWFPLAQRIEAWLKGAAPADILLGATIVNQEEADRDITKLLATPARARFLSLEPLLGPVTLPGFNGSASWCPVCAAIVPESLLPGHEMEVHQRRIGARYDPQKDCASVYNLIDWVIVGGESGPKARPMHPDWARSLRDQCSTAGVPLMFKQWGEWLPVETDCGGDGDAWGVADDGTDRELSGRNIVITTLPDGQQMAKVGKKFAGRVFDGQTHDGFPEAPHA